MVKNIQARWNDSEGDCREIGMSTTMTDEGPIADEDLDEFLGIYRPGSTRPRPEWIDSNVVFVPRTQSRYFEYAPLYHLLPHATVERFGLPIIRSGMWPPFISGTEMRSNALPADFPARSAAAWGSHICRHMMPGSPASGFTKDHPIRLLTHNLDFCLPPVTDVMQDILTSFPVVGDPIEPKPVPLEDGSVLEGAVLMSTRVGSDLWAGEVDAAEVTARTVDQADADGRLRGILDAVRSNRIEDDFSDRWTFAREDFERKLYRKRSKVKVTFVELTDTIPVQSPESDVIGQTVTADFLALLNERDREVVVLLNSGHTSLTEVAEIMGYANHSAVSKRLERIRRQAEHFFEMN